MLSWQRGSGFRSGLGRTRIEIFSFCQGPEPPNLGCISQKLKRLIWCHRARAGQIVEVISPPCPGGGDPLAQECQLLGGRPPRLRVCDNPVYHFGFCVTQSENPISIFSKMRPLHCSDCIDPSTATQGIGVSCNVLGDYIVWNASTASRGYGLFETALQGIAVVHYPKDFVQLILCELHFTPRVGAIPGEGFLCLLFGLLAKLSHPRHIQWFITSTRSGRWSAARWWGAAEVVIRRGRPAHRFGVGAGKLCRLVAGRPGRRSSMAMTD